MVEPLVSALMRGVRGSKDTNWHLMRGSQRSGYASNRIEDLLPDGMPGRASRFALAEEPVSEPCARCHGHGAVEALPGWWEVCTRCRGQTAGAEE